jgi:hypothetical protein
MKNLIKQTMLVSIGGLLATQLSAAVQPNTTANGVVYLTIDRAAWATVAPSADYFDIHGNDLGTNSASADVNGKRWMFTDRFEGTNWVAASYPSSYLTPLPDYPLVQPNGGFVLPVNTYTSNSFAANHEITSYNSTSNTNGYIGLGGSFRATSDFNEPGSSVWWEHLALAQDPADGIWKLYATSGPGQGSLFELRNVTAETINGNLHLSGDYVFGNTDWLQFFQDYNGHLDTNMILGHIELIPAGAAKVFAGKAVINYNQTAWEALAAGLAAFYGTNPPVLTLSGFFNQAQANMLNQSQLLTNVESGYSYSNQVYALNDATVTNLSSRYTQPTTFVYPVGSITNHTGKIGLGGVARFGVFGGSVGNLLFGDYTLQYDSSRIALGGSGWYLLANINPAAPAFDLLNVSVVDATNSFTISGDLGVSFEVANFLFHTSGDTLANVGTFNFTGYTVPPTTPTNVQLVISSGTATMTLDEGKADSIGWVDAYFSDAKTRGQILSDPALGDAPFMRLSGTPGTLGTSSASGTNGVAGRVQVIDTIRPFAQIPTPPLPDTYPGAPGASRSRQITTLRFNATNILGSWTPSTDSYGFYVNNTAASEQIAFTCMQRWGGPFTGVLVYGDFALRYVPSRAGTVIGGETLSGLVLTANIDFLNSSWADLANASISLNGDTLNISGDLLISGALNVLDPSAVVGTKFGTFNLVATVVPAPVTAPVIQKLKIASGKTIITATNGLPVASYNVLSTTNLALPVSSWDVVTNGYFSVVGKSSNSIPVNAAEPARYYRLQQQ